MDALTHAVEAYIGNSTTPGTRKDALMATELIFNNLEKAYLDGSNVQARKNMLKAAYYAGCAFTKSYVGYVHAVAHSLGGEYNVPHGLANAILLPFVLESYGESIHKKLHNLAIAAGVADADTPDNEAAKAFIDAIKEMKSKFNIKDIVSEIREEDIPKMANMQTKRPILSILYLFLWMQKLWNNSIICLCLKVISNNHAETYILYYNIKYKRRFSI